MNLIRTMTFTITIFFLGISASGDNPSASEILKKAADTYKTIKTYKVEGMITDVSEVNNIKKGVSEYEFSILLKKPNQYLITWFQTNKRRGDIWPMAVWSDGTQSYFYYGKIYSFYKMMNDEMALGYIKPSIIPSIFLPVFKDYETPFSWLKDPEVEKVEKIGEEDCYVIRGTSEKSKRETIWISKTSYKIRKYYQFRDYLDYSKTHLDYYKTNKSKLGMSDKEIEEHIENFKRLNMTGFYSEVYKESSCPKLNKNDFNFALPKGAVLKDYLD